MTDEEWVEDPRWSDSWHYGKKATVTRHGNRWIWTRLVPGLVHQVGSAGTKEEAQEQALNKEASA
jgi:hypothetical protein